MDYIALSFSGLNEQASEALSAMLMDAGFEGTEMLDNGFVAYIPASDYQAHNVEPLLEGWETEWTCQISKTIIEPVNWNHAWEKNFEPVLITDDVYVRASFHAPHPVAKFNILIEPKMSFGTGHHATTSMMIQYILELDVLYKTILDIGTGTGILAILASKAGAADITGTDIETWCIENALENAALNNCANIKIYMANDYKPESKTFDIIFANIQRNYFETHMQTIARMLKQGGKLVTSGYLSEDQNTLEQWAQMAGMVLESSKSHSDWSSQCFVRV